MRAPLNMEEFSAMAFIRSSRPDHFDEKGLARRNIKRVHDAQQRRQQDDFPDADVERSETRV